MPPKLAIFACGWLCASLTAQETGRPPAQNTKPQVEISGAPADYKVGTGDEISVRVLDFDEIPDRPFKIKSDGAINLALVGTLNASGLTVVQLQTAIAGKLRAFLKNPVVTVTLTTLREQSVSVLGAVNLPGMKEIRGRGTLLDTISEAGGFKPEAGAVVRLTRPKASGPIPLASAHLDASGDFYLAEVEIHSLLQAQNPRENIPVLAHDIVTVPVAEMVYVLGEVARPGGYEVQGSRTLSVLNAVALAGGANRNASSSHARVLRLVPGNPDPAEYVVDIAHVLAGKEKDFQLLPKDILYIPTNKGKVVSTRALEAMIGTGSSIAVFRGSR